MVDKIGNNWFVLTGGPSTGKSTLLSLLEKKSYATIPEAARIHIDKHLARGLTLKQIRGDEKKFQEEVLKLKVRLESKIDPGALTFFDRGMHDTVAYYHLYAYDIEEWITKIIKRAHYKKVFLLEPLSKYEKDNARIEDEKTASKLTDLLYTAYDQAGMKPTLVPPFSPEERADFVLNNLE